MVLVLPKKLAACLILLLLAEASFLAEASGPRHRKSAHKLHRKKRLFTSSPAPGLVTRTLVGHVVCYDCCSRSLPFLPGMTTVVECKNKYGLLVFNAVRTTDENGAFMVDLPDKHLAKCSARIATDRRHQGLRQHTASVSMEEGWHRNHQKNGRGGQQLVFTVGPLVYRKPSGSGEKREDGFVTRLLNHLGKDAAGRIGGGDRYIATWKTLSKNWFSKFVLRSIDSGCPCECSPSGGIERASKMSRWRI